MTLTDKARARRLDALRSLRAGPLNIFRDLPVRAAAPVAVPRPVGVRRRPVRRVHGDGTVTLRAA